MGTDKEASEKETIKQQISEQQTIESREDSIRRDYGFASDVELKECRYCRVMIPKKAKVCPNCRMNLKRHWLRNTVAAIFAAAVIGIGGYYLSEHWGIMRDAVMSVWMAQDGNAVQAVSVTTVGTPEMAASAVSTETSEVAVNTENTKTTGMEAAEPEERQADSNRATADKDAGADADTLTEDKLKEEESTEADATISETAKERKNTASADQEAEEEDSQEKPGETVAGEEDPQEKPGEAVAGEEDFQEKPGKTVTGEEDFRQTADDIEEETDMVPAGDLDEQEQAFRDDCKEVSYKALLRDTDTYLETALKVEIQVVCQVNGGLFDENVYYLCKVEEVNDIERYYIIRDDREEDATLILEGDTLTVYGQLFGNCKLPASLIETRPTVPAVSMLYFDLLEE